MRGGGVEPNECTRIENDHTVWRWEQRIVGAAERIVFVNHAQLDWHAERYTAAENRMLVVENGYEPAVYGDTDGTPAPRPEQGLRLGYIGTITHQLPLQEFFAGWRLARQ